MSSSTSRSSSSATTTRRTRSTSKGSRNVFEAARDAGAKRLVYTSSVAAYGFHDDNPELLTEDVPPRGSDGFYYSAHKAELESLLTETLAGSDTKATCFGRASSPAPTR